jgi:hypothetical protein
MTLRLTPRGLSIPIIVSGFPVATEQEGIPSRCTVIASSSNHHKDKPQGLDHKWNGPKKHPGPLLTFIL